MTARSSSAFLLSVAFHVVVIALLLLLGYAAGREAKDPPRILELVAGEGDNFAAKEAPALGTPGGQVKLDLPPPPEPKPEPKVEPPPETKTEMPPPPPSTPAPAKAPEAPPAPNFKRQIQRQIVKAESKAKKEIEKDRAAEAKRLADEKKRLTKAEFDAKNKKAAASAPAPAKSAPTKVAKIDAEGIAKGVAGGSTANKTGGAGGRALTSDNDDVMAAYFTMLKDRSKRAFEQPTGVSDSLIARVSVRSHADGSLSGARIIKSSGSSEFDQAVLEAIRRVAMPARPDGKSEEVTFLFSMREIEED